MGNRKTKEEYFIGMVLANLPEPVELSVILNSILLEFGKPNTNGKPYLAVSFDAFDVQKILVLYKGISVTVSGYTLECVLNTNTGKVLKGKLANAVQDLLIDKVFGDGNV